MKGQVAVGVDGSRASLAAVEAAAHEAAMRGVGLRVVHAFVWPATHAPRGSPLGPPGGTLREDAEALTAGAVERARSAAPDLDVTSAITTGETGVALVAQSRTAQLIVVGGHGAGAVPSSLLGSTAEYLAGHAECPVMVVRGRSAPAGPVLLAMDGSTAGRPAIEFAFAESSLRHRDVVALHVEDDGPFVDERGRIGAEERELRDMLSGPHGRHPDVAVDVRVVRGETRRTLIEASADAGLLVTGTRGHGGLTGLLLGSVSRALLRHAQCPVTVVRADGNGS
ncbi:universal stress protein [Streptomyces sp. NPDC046237]|uniref:universal stress protein n=1 Tax=Streptomyces sp. NPDC046237 TaxID=3154914 RepID=UPI0033C99BF3